MLALLLSPSICAGWGWVIGRAGSSLVLHPCYHAVGGMEHKMAPMDDKMMLIFKFNV
jgi:hypothetical protein